MNKEDCYIICNINLYRPTIHTLPLGSTSFPKGIGLPFSLAILCKVAKAFSEFPLVMSYLALSGNH